MWDGMRSALPLLLCTIVAVGCRTVEDMQRDYAHRLAPKAFHPEPTASAELGVTAKLRHLHVRVYLDDDFRAQILRGEESVRRQLRRASDVMAAEFGVQLDLVDVRPWAHRGGERLDRSLDALEQLDPGTDVEW